MTVHHEGASYSSRLARVFIDPGYPHSVATVNFTVEVYVRGVTDSGPIYESELDVALWTDIDRLGFVDEKGTHYPDFGYIIPMKPARDAEGNYIRCGNNAVFESGPVAIKETGVFSYTVDLSADDYDINDPAKSWISINDIAHNQDGVIVSSPAEIIRCPSIMEVCARKYGAAIEDGEFISGKLKNITNDIDNIPVEIIYLLPFFEPGTSDIITGGDVRKGTLGSVYAVKDFFRIDPKIVSNPKNVDIHNLIAKGLITDYDLVDILGGKQLAALTHTADFSRFKSNDEIVSFIGEDAATQLTGRAELRELVQKAHSKGKKVIFDLVLMQTSRDSKLINEHRDWYALDENGAPKIHSIAWLVYSDVALFDLMFNKPLQNYLSSIAPYWIRTCDLDGVRIDASQTVDRAFLKQIKNRINDVKRNAIIVGETLCPICESVDIPVDIIYSLLVDHHVHVDHATPYYDLFETYHHTFTKGTRAIAYFENHDSERATAQWIKRFDELLIVEEEANEYWDKLNGVGEKASTLMAMLKNIQCSLINMVSGSMTGVNFCYAIENGTDFGERVRTDFENATLLNFELRNTGLGQMLHSCYEWMYKTKTSLNVIWDGNVYYLRNNTIEGQDDRVFAVIRHNGDEKLLLLANLDPHKERRAGFKMDFLDLKPLGKYPVKILFDSYKSFEIKSGNGKPSIMNGNELINGMQGYSLMPLQSILMSF